MYAYISAFAGTHCIYPRKDGQAECYFFVCVCLQIKLFVFHPSLQKMVESTLMVHMNATLADATRIAWKVCLPSFMLTCICYCHCCFGFLDTINWLLGSACFVYKNVYR